MSILDKYRNSLDDQQLINELISDLKGDIQRLENQLSQKDDRITQLESKMNVMKESHRADMTAIVNENDHLKERVLANDVLEQRYHDHSHPPPPGD